VQRDLSGGSSEACAGARGLSDPAAGASLSCGDRLSAFHAAGCVSASPASDRVSVSSSSRGTCYNRNASAGRQGDTQAPASASPPRSQARAV